MNISLLGHAQYSSEVDHRIPGISCRGVGGCVDYRYLKGSHSSQPIIMEDQLMQMMSSMQCEMKGLMDNLKNEEGETNGNGLSNVSASSGVDNEELNSSKSALMSDVTTSSGDEVKSDHLHSNQKAGIPRDGENNRVEWAGESVNIPREDNTLERREKVCLSNSFSTCTSLSNDELEQTQTSDTETLSPNGNSILQVGCWEARPASPAICVLVNDKETDTDAIIVDTEPKEIPNMVLTNVSKSKPQKRRPPTKPKRFGKNAGGGKGKVLKDYDKDTLSPPLSPLGTETLCVLGDDIHYSEGKLKQFTIPVPDCSKDIDNGPIITPHNYNPHSNNSHLPSLNTIQEDPSNTSASETGDKSNDSSHVNDDLSSLSTTETDSYKDNANMADNPKDMPLDDDVEAKQTRTDTNLQEGNNDKLSNKIAVDNSEDTCEKSDKLSPLGVINAQNKRRRKVGGVMPLYSPVSEVPPCESEQPLSASPVNSSLSKIQNEDNSGGNSREGSPGPMGLSSGDLQRLRQLAERSFSGDSHDSMDNEDAVNNNNNKDIKSQNNASNASINKEDTMDTKLERPRGLSSMGMKNKQGMRRILSMPNTSELEDTVGMKDVREAVIRENVQLSTSQQRLRRLSITNTSSHLDQLKVVADQMKLKTRRPSVTAWKNQYMKPVPVLRGSWQTAREVDGEWSEERKHKIDSALEWIRNELKEMQAQDQDLAKTLITLRKDIRDYKLQKCYEQNRDVLDDALDIYDEKEFQSELTDGVPEQFSPMLKDVGITKMNIAARRFSVF